MAPIRIHTFLDSTTLNLPDVLPLVGKRVEIIIREESPTTLPPQITPGTGDWEGARKAVESIKDYDFDAVRDMDAADLAQDLWRDA